MSTTRFERALVRFDEENSKDPRSVRHNGRDEPVELVYSNRMSALLGQFAPDAGESLRLAVHAQHLCRWRLPRAELPSDRSGYLEWRRRCGEMHADLAGAVMREVGYPDPMILEVGRLLRKEGLRTDPQAQTLEDVACLVFLENYAEEFLSGRDEDSVERILRRTWRKMSARARAASMELPLPAAVSSLAACLLAEEGVLEGERKG
jgi:hypothetical protein